METLSVSDVGLVMAVYTSLETLKLEDRVHQSDPVVKNQAW